MKSRNHSFHIWFNDDEYLDLKKRKLHSGLTESDIIRLALKGQAVKSNPPKEFYTLLTKINNIGNNINQIAHVANTNGEIYYEGFNIYYKEISKFIEEVRDKYL